MLLVLSNSQYSKKENEDAQEVSYDAHLEFLYNILTIKLLSIVEDVRVGS